VHISSPDGEAKYWLEPEVELAKNYRLTSKDLTRIEELITERREEITSAWVTHFRT